MSESNLEPNDGDRAPRRKRRGSAILLACLLVPWLAFMGYQISVEYSTGQDGPVTGAWNRIGGRALLAALALVCLVLLPYLLGRRRDETAKGLGALVSTFLTITLLVAGLFLLLLLVMSLQY